MMAPADEMQEQIEVGFEDLMVVSDDEGADVFALNWNEPPYPPPFFIVVAGRRFRFSGKTFLLKGYGANMARFLQEQEAEGRLVLLVERDNLLYIYVHDPAVEAESEDEEA
jgi:hypothetical protein